jgi:ubiquinone/menaquinone biosynthesis C-methylase UbiE
MAEPQIRFDDGASYERFMGVWSRMAGDVFIDWLKPATGLKWVDIGCGNGAFTENIVERCAPLSVDGVDPSEGQLAFARTRPAARLAKFHQGDAMALPFADKTFDAAVMALVIFFVPEPEKGVAELARVTKPGGLVATYAWDVLGGGFPMEPLQAAMREVGIKPILPPRADASRLDALVKLWNGAGIEAVETREITVQRTYAEFDEFWATTQLSAGIVPIFAKMSAAELESLKAMVRGRLPADSSGRITYSARANAIKGRMPK